jgi:hypothetical protein
LLRPGFDPRTVQHEASRYTKVKKKKKNLGATTEF